MNLYQDLILPDCKFTNPMEVLAVDALTKAEKIRILRQWEYDAQEKEVAQDEGMQATSDSHIDEIHSALRLLGVDPNGGMYT